jgi:hypothetical protein
MNYAYLFALLNITKFILCEMFNMDLSSIIMGILIKIMPTMCNNLKEDCHFVIIGPLS